MVNPTEIVQKKTCSDEFLYLGGFFSGGFASSEILEGTVPATIITYSILGILCGNQNGNGNTNRIPRSKKATVTVMEMQIGTQDSWPTRNLGRKKVMQINLIPENKNGNGNGN